MDKRLVGKYGSEVKLGLCSWKEAAQKYNDESGEKIDGEILRNRFRRFS